MKGIHYILALALLTACTSEPTEEPVSSEVIQNIPKQDSIEEEEAATVDVPLQQMYTAGRYYLKLDRGSIIMLIHAKTDTTCRFVFDTGAGTPYFAKLAGDLSVDKQGRATYSGNSCEALDFHFTEDGIRVKEFNCSQFRSRTIAFDGFYTTEEPLNDNPAVLLRQVEREEVPFDFYASFTEPFWTLYFIGDKVLFNHMDEDPDFYQLNQPFDPEQDAQTLKFSSGKRHWEVLIEKGEGSDGMSDITYPYKVIMNDEFHGGGGVEFQKEQ